MVSLLLALGRVGRFPKRVFPQTLVLPLLSL